ncbi:MAG: F0F1 ATP synthase subunit delta [Candidatus Moranbacteria bacterium]|nr:F0F1 ATP synthase subunit delta [Candidatus Moranbacteria bacterium]
MKVTSKQYAKFLYDIASGKEAQQGVLIKKIAKVIKKNRDEKKLEEIEKIFRQIQKKEEGIVDAAVYSREKMSDDQMMKIKESIAKKKNIAPENVHLANQVDEDIKGGLLIRVENEIFDGTLKSKLERMKKAVTSL